jgi:hypothetical protein
MDVINCQANSFFARATVASIVAKERTFRKRLSGQEAGITVGANAPQIHI